MLTEIGLTPTTNVQSQRYPPLAGTSSVVRREITVWSRHARARNLNGKFQYMRLQGPA
jgi:hypothetical protein